MSVNGDESLVRSFYDQDSTFWQEYHRIRPEYPAELFQLLFDYHSQHSDSWKLAIDYGTGPGTIIPTLLSRFEKVLATDANVQQLDDVRPMFEQRFAKRVELRQGLAGECSFLESDSADICVAAEAVHWFDYAKFHDEAVKVLRKGGTFCFFLYPPYADIVSPVSERAVQCLYGLYDEVLKPAAAKMGETLRHACRTQISRLDCLPIDSTHFTHEERHKWIGRAQGPKYEIKEMFLKAVEGAELDKVSAQAKVVEHLNPEAMPFLTREGWTIDNLLGYLDSLGVTPREQYLQNERVQQLLADLEAELGGKDKTFTMGWWFSLVMATKK